MALKRGPKAPKPSEVDEEQSLSVIENKDFLKMRSMQKVWPEPATTAEDLELLVERGMLQQQSLSYYELPGE